MMVWKPKSSLIRPSFRALQMKALLLWCCYITVDSATTALQNGACTIGAFPKQMHHKTPFSHNGSWKFGILWKQHHSVLYHEKKITVWDVILTQNHAWLITQSGWNNHLVSAEIKQQHHSVTCSVEECTVMWCSSLWCRCYRILLYM